MTNAHLILVRLAWHSWTCVAMLLILAALVGAFAEASGPIRVVLGAALCTFAVRLTAEGCLPVIFPPDPAVPTLLSEWRLYRSDLGDYMHRWILQSPWGAIRLHHILKSDEVQVVNGVPAIHDHPWHFWSFLISGGYREWLSSTTYKDHPRWSLIRRQATDAHRLELRHGPVWSIVWAGPYHRQWGFWVPELHGESNLGITTKWVSWPEWRDRRPDLVWANDPARVDATSKLPNDGGFDV